MYYLFKYMKEAKAFMRENGGRIVAWEYRMDHPQSYRVFIPK